MDQAMADYWRLGYSESWITRRIKTIEIRKGLTDEWNRGGITNKIALQCWQTWCQRLRVDWLQGNTRSVISSPKPVDYIQCPEELPFEKPDEQ